MALVSPALGAAPSASYAPVPPTGGAAPSPYTPAAYAPPSTSYAPPPSQPLPPQPTRQAPPTVRYARALYNFSPEAPTELGFQAGETITVVGFNNAEWWVGEVNGRRGEFPSNYVQLI